MKKQSSDRSTAGGEEMAGTILVVEDDRGLSRLIQGRLERLNFRVETVISGAQAMERLASNRVELALLDYSLPDMTGTELIEALVKSKCSVPFIVITGRGDETLAVEMMKRGARDYMVKDTTFLERLPMAVQRTFDQLATERKLAEAGEELEESEAKLSLVFQSISDGIIVSDLKGQIIDENEAAVRLQGYSDKEDVIGRNGFEFIAERDRARATEDAVKAIEVGYGPAHEYTFVDKDGREYDAEASASLLRNSAGNAVGYISIFRDITERKRAEAALRASEEKLRAMFDAITDGIVITDLQGIILDVNDVAARMTNLSREEMIGKDGFSLVPREDKDKIVAPGKKIVRGETGPVRMEHEISPKVGVSSTTNLVLGTMYDSEGNPSGFVAIAQDFTERKKAEIALRESEAKYRDLVESINDVIYSVDVNGVTTYISPVVESILGYTTSELIGSSFADFMYREDLTMATEGFMNTLAGNTQTGEFRVVTRSGEIRWVRSSNHPVFEEDRVIGVTGVITDITERKRAEEERERLIHELERSNAELQQFAHVASHDLQEPLRMVASYTQLLEKRYKGRLDADADDFIAYAVDGAKRMQNLILGLLSYSRVGSRGKTFQPTECESVFEQVLDNLQVAIEESGAEVTHDALPRVMADDTQLVQLFQNLLANAIKFRDDEQPRIHVSAKEDSNEVLFSIGDNGIGISPEYFDRIFVIFQRLHGREAYPGTGIGLSVCKRIVERHGGRIWVESQPGEGSIFYFTIPKGGEQQ